MQHHAARQAVTSDINTNAIQIWIHGLWERPLGGWLSAGHHSSDAKTENKQCDQTKEEQGLAWVSVSQIGVEEWHDDCGGESVQDMNGIGRSRSIDVEDETKDSLDDDQDLANHQRAREGATERLATSKRYQPPYADRGHEQDHRRRESIVEQQDGRQRSISSNRECR